MSSSRSWRVSGSDISRCCISSAERRISGSDRRRSDMAWKRVDMSFIEASCATWMRMGWLAAATTASACTRTISMPLQPRHSPLRPQWQSCARRRSSAACSSDMSAGPAMPTNLRGTWRLLLPVVHRLDLLLVALLDDLPFDVQLERELAVRLREVLGQQGEVLNPLPGAVALVGRVDRLLDALADGSLVESCLASRVPVGHDQGRDIWPSVPDHDRPFDERVVHQLVLKGLRRDVLAHRGFEERLLAVCDEEEAVAIDDADVTRVQPTILEDLGRGLRLVVVAEHVARALDENLAVVRDLQLDAAQGLTHGPEPVRARCVQRRPGAGLGQAPALIYGHPHRPEEFLDILCQRGAATDEHAQAPPHQPLPQWMQHEPVGQAVLKLQVRGGWVVVREATPSPNRPTEQRASHRRGGAHALQHCGVHLLVYTRDACHQGGMDLANVCDQPVDAPRHVHLAAHG